MTPGRGHRITPREHWAAVVQQHGPTETVSCCVDVLSGAITADRPDAPALAVLDGGAYRQRILAGEAPDYWLRVWAARGLLYVWDETAVPAVITGLADDHWRVREMSAKVSRLRLLGQAGDDLARLVADDVPRVRKAALRALGEVGETEHAVAVHAALGDHDPDVAATADDTLGLMAQRLDRDLRTELA